MNNIKKSFIKLSIFAGILLVGLSMSISAQKKDKMTAEELIAKHLESIGTAEARNAVKTMTVVGTSKAVKKGRGTGYTEGVVVIASEKNKYLVGMKFNNPDYQFEKMAFNGKDFSIGYATPGERSVLGDFLRTNENTFERGIMGGTLVTSWELLNLNEDEVRVKYGGMEKIDGKKYHELKFEPKKGFDMTVSMFFDPDTFHHIRTEYRRVINANLGGSVDTSARQNEKRYKLVEDFSDFKEENKLILPHNYKMAMEIITGNGSVEYEWVMNLQNFFINQPIEDNEFVVDSK